MGKPVLLNSVEHQDLRIITRHGAELGDNQWFTPTFPQEFRAVQAHYPIFFYKDPGNGQFHPVALFGFRRDDNLFLDEQGWRASYVPLTVRRQPFLIGQQTVQEDGMAVHQRVIHIDLDHPKVSLTEGEPLFQPYGGNTPYLDEMAEMLEVIHQGMEDSKGFVDALLTHDLLEAFTLELTLDNGDSHQMIGFYTINESTLAQLGGPALEALHQAGYLQAIYLSLASQARVRDLMQVVNDRLAESAA
ncbi:SapC family protein [Ferrimonas balearica]|uniref:SapC family protein n=1 Tax=Ferrimonas balearica TaxID=44012 RepID=UPI001C995B48|nr:SapC family protein [Ferrimonas balearica]MBY5993982.1 SapC family protein [Ferrimonas balearica]